jgi:hypothetical protein
MLPQTLRCNSISYRKGFVERSCVRYGCVTLEWWSVRSETDLSGVDIRDRRISDDVIE